MIKFLANNYEWIFSGFGVLIISILFGLFKGRKVKPTDAIKINKIEIKEGKDANVQIANNLVNHHVVINTLATDVEILDNEPDIIFDKLPIDILVAVNNTPPFHKESFEDGYKGLLVNWVVNFSSIYSKDNKIYHVTTEYDKSYVLIFFDIDIEKYPIFKIAKKDDEFMITGKILKVSGYDIEIEIRSITKNNFR